MSAQHQFDIQFPEDLHGSDSLLHSFVSQAIRSRNKRMMSHHNPNRIGGSIAEQLSARLKLTSKDPTITDRRVWRRRIDSCDDRFAHSQNGIQLRRYDLLIETMGSQHPLQESIERHIVVSRNDQLWYRRQTRQKISSRLKLLPLCTLCQIAADDDGVNG